MSTATIETVKKMLEGLPRSVQERAVEHLREYLEEVTDEMRWDESFTKSSESLSEIAEVVQKDIADGKTKPMDFDGTNTRNLMNPFAKQHEKLTNCGAKIRSIPRCVSSA